MKATIKLSMPNGSYLDAAADVFGNWAVHRENGLDHGEWKVTHVPSGLAATCEYTNGLSEADAVRVAAHLSHAVAELPYAAESLRESAMRLHSTGERDECLSRLVLLLRLEIREALGLH